MIVFVVQADSNKATEISDILDCIDLILVTDTPMRSKQGYNTIPGEVVISRNHKVR